VLPRLPLLAQVPVLVGPAQALVLADRGVLPAVSVEVLLSRPSFSAAMARSTP
jgi:hypothetical protein